MTTRQDFVDAKNDMETILLDLEDVTPSGLSDKKVILAFARCFWIILDYIIRGYK